MDKVFDIEELINLFKSKLWIILLITVIATGLGVYKASKMNTYYETRVKVAISTNNDGGMLSLYSSEQSGAYTSIINTFKELIVVDDFLNGVLDKNGIEKTASEVSSNLQFETSEQSPIITIVYSSSNDSEGEKILNAICSEFSAEVRKIIPEAKVTVIDSPKIFSVVPNKSTVILMGFAVGIIISILLIIALDFLDNRIKSVDQLEKILLLPVLGEIPTEEKYLNKEVKDDNSKSNAAINISGSI